MRSIAVVCFSVFVAALALGCSARDLSAPQRRLLSGDNLFNYLYAGEDWFHDFPDCAGREQSPINIVTSDAETALTEVTARIGTFGTGSNVEVVNEGQAIKVTWEQDEAPIVELPVSGGKVAGSIDPFASIRQTVATSITRTSTTGSGGTVTTRVTSHGSGDDRVTEVTTTTGGGEQFEEASRPEFSFARVKLLQFHFHISSENAVNGQLAPMEAHLVSVVPKEEVPECGDPGCIVVFATMFELGDENTFLEEILEAVPEHHGEEHAEKFPADFKIKLDDLVPEGKGYYTWAGSFTTPPCTEGVTWILFEKYQTISSRQVSEVQRKMGAVHYSCQESARAANSLEEFEQCNFFGNLRNNRAVQPMNDRVVKFVPQGRISN